MGKLKQTISELADLWIQLRERDREQKEKYRIDYAFTSGGRRYYQYADIRNLPYQRGRAALSIYNEITMRCSREFLVEYTKAVDEALAPKRLDIYQVKKLNDMLKDRLTLVADMDLCYKLAACVFFDKTERPEVYEPEYADKKIARWKKDQSAADFFLQRPLMELMPFLKNAGPDVDTFTQLSDEINKLHAQLMRLNGSTSSKTPTTAGRRSSAKRQDSNQNT